MMFSEIKKFERIRQYTPLMKSFTSKSKRLKAIMYFVYSSCSASVLREIELCLLFW